MAASVVAAFWALPSLPAAAGSGGGVHVTRLHRYDHSGLAAMVEREARWHAPGLAEDLQHDDGAGFVQLSQRQASALREVHRLGTGKGARGARTWRTRGPLGPVNEGGKTGANALTNLDSQYVARIGVGSVDQPQGCATSAGGSVAAFLESSAGKIRSTGEACRLQDQEELDVVLDTGSTNLWVNSDLCRKGACVKPGRHRYNHSQSGSYRKPKDGYALTIQFGTGEIKGEQAIDNFRVGDFWVQNQYFGMIQQEEGQVFEQCAFDGIMGLGFPKLSANHVPPFFDNIIQQKVLKRNLFSFYLSPKNPAANAIFWGDVDKTFYKGDLQWFNVSEPYYWSVGLQSFRIGNEEMLPRAPRRAAGFLQTRRSRGEPTGEAKGWKAIVDTGTTFFTAEGEMYDKVMTRLRALPCREINQKSHPPLTYRLTSSSGKPTDYVLGHKQYMTASGPKGDEFCEPAFMEIRIPPEHGPGLVLGEVFLRCFLSVFDRGDGRPGRARVGLAEANTGEEVERKLKDLTQAQKPFNMGPTGAALVRGVAAQV